MDGEGTTTFSRAGQTFLEGDAGRGRKGRGCLSTPSQVEFILRYISLRKKLFDLHWSVWPLTSWLASLSLRFLI